MTLSRFRVRLSAVLAPEESAHGAANSGRDYNRQLTLSARKNPRRSDRCQETILTAGIWQELLGVGSGQFAGGIAGIQCQRRILFGEQWLCCLFQRPKCSNSINVNTEFTFAVIRHSVQGSHKDHAVFYAINTAWGFSGVAEDRSRTDAIRIKGSEHFYLAFALDYRRF